MRTTPVRSAIVAAALAWGAAGAAQEAPPDAPGLVITLKTGDPASRASAARILGELGPKAKEAVPALAEALKDEDKDVRRNALTSLGQMGRAAAEAVPAIVPTLGEASWETRKAAATALGAIGDPSAEKPLKAARKDPNDKVREAAKRALGQLRKTRKY